MKVISLINMKGGVGKTTMAVNICDCLATRYDSKVLLVDIDPQFNATQCLMSGDKYVKYLKAGKDTILSIFEKDVRAYASSIDGPSTKTAKKLDEIKACNIKKNFDLIPGNLNLFQIEMASGEGRENRLSKYLKGISEQYDFVIIDTPPTPSIWMTSALIASDFYLIPVKPEPLSFTGIDLLHGIIEDKRENLDLKIKCLGIIYTMVEEDSIVFRQAKASLSSGRWKDYQYKKFMHKRTVIAREQTNGGFILSLDKDECKVALVGIVKEMLKRIER